MQRTIMLIRSIPLLCGALAAATSFSGPLEKSYISADTKWLLHLDADAFRDSAVGAHLINNLLQPRLDKEEQIKKLNLSLNLQNISSITAYGTGFDKNPDCVLILKTTADVKKDLDTLSGMAALGGADFIKMVEDKPDLLYSFQNSLFIAPGKPANTVFVGKSRQQVERARDVALGKEESLAKSETFSSFPEASSKPFFLAMIDDLNRAPHMPPQAQVLKEARGGRVAMGEIDQNVFVNLVLRGKDEEGTAKIQQVLQGIVALVSMSQDNKEITELANSTKISSRDENVVVNLQCPVAKVIERCDEHVKETNDRPKRAKKAKKLKKADKAEKVEEVPAESKEN